MMFPSWSLETMRPISRPYLMARWCAGEEPEAAAVVLTVVFDCVVVVVVVGNPSSVFDPFSSSSSFEIDFKTSFRDFLNPLHEYRRRRFVHEQHRRRLDA